MDADNILTVNSMPRCKLITEVLYVPVNVPYLAAMLGVSEKTIKRDIAAMQSAGFIKRIGSDKTGHWEIVGQNN